MEVVTFKRGIHLEDKKDNADSPIFIMNPKTGASMVFPMVQHIGAACVPIVEIGERVLMGQKIGQSIQAMSAAVHSSISGIVKDIKINFTPNGIRVNSVVVENDGLLEEHPSIVIDEDFNKHSREYIMEKIKECGIVGLGGAGFPTHIKYSPPDFNKIEYIIVNGAECEPYLTTDHRVLLEESERIKSGLQIILKIFPNAKGLIAIETNKMNAINYMENICKDDNRIEVIKLLPKYPQGAEKQLIKACTGREVPSGKLPCDVGIIVNNVDTVIAVHRAIVRGRPLMRKVLTITGGAIRKQGNYKVRLGTLYSDLVNAIGGFSEEPYKIIYGGPMMGVSMFDLNVPVVKTSSALICLTEKELVLSKESNCIRCGKCVTYCPIGLMPLELNQNAISRDFDRFEKNNGLDCIECGACSYICPSKRYLAQSIRATRRIILGNRRI